MNERSERLGNEKISKLLFNLSMPATIGMIVNALYNVVDTIFIGRGVGTLAIGGLSIAFPIQMIIMAFAQMVGIGAASAISRSLGAGEVEKADHVAGNSFGAVLLISAIVMSIGLIFTDPVLRIFGATDAILPYARDYIRIILMGSVFFSFTVSSNNLVRAEGNAKVSMIAMLIGTGLNIVFDPIFIFALDMGIRGAAIATILSQFFSFIYITFYLYGDSSTLKVRWHHLRPDYRILKEIFTVGLASFARQVAGSFVAILVNHSLAFYGGDLAISIFGIIRRVTMFLFMPLFGVVQGLQPIVGFNYGAKKYGRVREVIKLSIIVTTVFASTSVLFGELFPYAIFGIFSTDAELISQGAPALRLVIMMIPVIGVQIVGAALFQSLGKAVPSLVLSLLRQVLVLIPLLLFLPRVGNLALTGIWISYPLADLISTLLTGILIFKEMNKMKECEDAPAESSCV